MNCSRCGTYPRRKVANRKPSYCQHCHAETRREYRSGASQRRDMSDKSWKAWERRVAHIFGGARRGADYGDVRGGKTDVIHEHFAIECKLLSRPTWSALVGAVKQAESNGEPGQEPVAVVKKKYQEDKDALVIMRLETFEKWRL